MLGLFALVVLPLVLESSPPEAERGREAGRAGGAGPALPVPAQVRITPLTGEERVLPAPDRRQPRSEEPPAEAAPASARAVKGWAVQVGVFVNTGNAAALRDRLGASGFRAFTEPIPSHDGKPRVRVLVGPDRDRSTAAAWLKRLQRDASVEGFIVRYPG